MIIGPTLGYPFLGTLLAPRIRVPHTPNNAPIPSLKRPQSSPFLAPIASQADPTPLLGRRLLKQTP